MEFAGNNLQIFISLTLILCAAAVALVCELLKRNNEHLRELNAELRVRNEEERLRNQMLIQSAAALTAVSPSLPAPKPVPEPAAPAPQAALDRGAEYASRHGRRHEPRHSAAEPPAAAEPQPGTTLAEARQLAREFMGRAAAKAGHPVERTRNEVQPETPRTPEIIIERPASVEATILQSRRKNWDNLLSRTRTAEAKSRVIPFEAPNQASDLPAGFQEGMTLARLLASGKTVRGLVLVIGINDYHSRLEAAGELGLEALLGSVADHIKSILLPGEFACRKSEDEFVIISPNHAEAASQKRLGDIAESLWDYQLRMVGTSSILFSWGDVEAANEPLADSLTAAAERMRETRRGRRALSLEVPMRRRAV